MRVTSKSWDEAKVVRPRDEICRRRIRFARKQKHRDAADLQQRAEAAPVEGEITEFLGA